ncbi:MAG: hypothetical protein ABDH28_05280 [Brevinematia bacterium]
MLNRLIIYLLPLILLLSMQLPCFARNVIIFPFYNKDGKDIPTASVGVLKSIMQFAKFYPSAKIVESSFDIKNRDISDIIKTITGYDSYIVGYFSKKDNIFNYHISIYDSKGNVETSFSASSEDLFEIADSIMSKIFSFYSGKTTGFATLSLKLELDEKLTYTILLNDEVLSSVVGKTNISVKVISKVPYHIIVRNDQTKEVVLSKTILLMDNETLSFPIGQVKQEEKKEVVDKIEQKPDVDQTTLKIRALQDIKRMIESKFILDDDILKATKSEAKILDGDLRLNLYNRYHIPIGITILGSVLNIIPGLGSLVLNDTGGIIISLFTPYLSLGVALILSPESQTISLAFSGIAVFGYIYNLVRPFIYTHNWNTRLREVLLLDEEKVSLSVSYDHVALNIKF